MSLSEKLAFLTNPNPKLLDAEEDNDDTLARLTDKGEVDESIDVSTSRLRQQTQVFLEDDDIYRRYAGKPVSRNVLSYQDKGADFNEDSDHLSQSDSESSDHGSRNEESSEIGLANQVVNDSDSANQVESDGASEDQIDIGEESEDDDALQEFKSKVLRSDTKNKSFTFTDDGDYGKYADDVNEVSDDEDDDSDSEEGSEDITSDDDDGQNDSMIGHEDTEDGVQSFSKRNVDDEVRRGQATKAQLGLWDTLLETRIKLQKTLVAVNQLPQTGECGLFYTEGGEEYQQELRQCEDSVKQLLDHFVQLQTLLLLQCPETKSVAKGETSNSKTNRNITVKAEDDEEILSDDEEVITKDEEDEEEEEQQRQQLKRKLKMSSYPEFLAKRHKAFENYRDETIQKWYDKTRIASGKLGKGFSAFESSALKQIQQILSDKNRLIRRTQLKRSTYRVLGKQEKKCNQSGESSDEEKTESDPLRKDHLKDYDGEIFDDDDFYHQLLRQLIERKTSDINDPIALSRQWLEIQKYRSKVKKKVDTKASKGRKLRYDIHTKLVNFMAPFETCTWTDQARDDLYSSLFGKRQQQIARTDNQDSDAVR